MMKVEKIATSLEEYNRLQKLIDELKTAEIDLYRFGKNKEGYAEEGIVSVELHFNMPDHKNIRLSSDTTEFIRHALLRIFEEKIKELKSKQNALEVE